MKTIFIYTALISFIQLGISQVGIGTETPDPSAILDIESTETGILIPRMTSAQRALIPSPANGLMIYNTDSDELQFNSNSEVTPIWEALSLTPVSAIVAGTSVKYSNTDVTTDVNPDTAITLPLFGTMEWNDNATLYNVTGNAVTITETGRYEFIINVSILNIGGVDRNAPEMRISINGTQVGTFGSTGYIRSNSNHEESSLHIREVLEITAGEVVTIEIFASANTEEVLLRSAGSSNIYIEKIK